MYTINSEYYPTFKTTCTLIDSLNNFKKREIIELLISFGADINLKNKVGLTAYDMAQRAGYYNIANYLNDRIEAPAVNIQENYQETRCLIN